MHRSWRRLDDGFIHYAASEILLHLPKDHIVSSATEHLEVSKSRGGYQNQNLHGFHFATNHEALRVLTYLSLSLHPQRHHQPIRQRAVDNSACFLGSLWHESQIVRDETIYTKEA